MFLLWMTTAFFLQFGYYGINNWMPSYLETEVHMNFKNLTSYMVGSYTAMILGKILAGYLADKFNRRAVFVFGTIASAVFLPIIIFFNTPDNILYLLITFGFLYGIPYGVNATYMAESFQPTCAEQPLAVPITLVVSEPLLHQLSLVSWHRAVRLPWPLL